MYTKLNGLFFTLFTRKSQCASNLLYENKFLFFLLFASIFFLFHFNFFHLKIISFASHPRCLLKLLWLIQEPFYFASAHAVHISPYGVRRSGVNLNSQLIFCMPLWKYCEYHSLFGYVFFLITTDQALEIIATCQ